MGRRVSYVHYIARVAAMLSAAVETGNVHVPKRSIAFQLTTARDRRARLCSGSVLFYTHAYNGYGQVVIACLSRGLLWVQFTFRIVYTIPAAGRGRSRNYNPDSLWCNVIG